MIAAGDLVHHGAGVVGVADDALATAVQGEFLTAQQVASGPLTLCLKIPGRADVGPPDILALPQLGQRLAHP